MAKQMGLKKVKIFKPSAMKRVALQHLTVFVKRVQGGLDAKGKAFPPYSDTYADIKGRRFTRKSDGKRYKSMKGLPITSTETENPDFTLTGRTLSNLKPKQIKKNGYVLRFTGQAGEIVKGNKINKRDITSDVPEKEKRFIKAKLIKELRKEFKRLKNVKIPINIKIG